jgi:hypothetical protein
VRDDDVRCPVAVEIAHGHVRKVVITFVDVLLAEGAVAGVQKNLEVARIAIPPVRIPVIVNAPFGSS